MAVTAYVLAVLLPASGATALMRGDNKAAVSWINRGGSAQDCRCRGLLRLLGVIELHSGWSFSARHVPGSHNQAADGITRLPPQQIEAKLKQLYPQQQQWRQHSLGASTLRSITAALDGAWPPTAWEQGL